MMEISDIRAVVGTNAWGSDLYETLLRGNAVSEDTLRECVSKAKDMNLAVFDTAQDYGLGKCQPMMGRLCDKECLISSKYTPMKGTYEAGQVRASLEQDLKEMNRDFIDIYWLHLPNAYRENLLEMAQLYKEGLIHHIGVSNFEMNECMDAKAILEQEGVPLYGVQNHYSLLNRDWEENGLFDWCKDNHISFWAWAVLEEGVLTGIYTKTIMMRLFAGKQEKLEPLFYVMKEIGRAHDLSIAGVAIAYVANKGIVPVVGCRSAKRIEELNHACHTILREEEVTRLESLCDTLDVRVFGKDIFRFAVKK